MFIFTTCISFLLINTCAGNVGKWNVFSTKTAYPWAANTQEPSVDEGTHVPVNSKLCKAIHVSMVVRHGARYPSDSATEEIADLQRHLLHYENGPKFKEVSNWVSPYREELASDLAPMGEKEQSDIGRRIAKKYQTLFTNSGQYVKFVSSSKERALDSSLSFYNGMKGVLTSIWRYKNQVNNSITRFYDGCENYERQVEDNDTHFTEFIKFDETKEFLSIMRSLKTKLGLDSLLDPEDVYVIYELCAYDRYIQDKISFWCDLLTDNERQILEYGQDIEKYYESSYGHPINSRMTCPLVSDVFHTMDKAMNDTWNYDRLPPEAKSMGYVSGKFRFGHSETVVPLMTALGLFKDDQPLRASNRLAMENRKFKTSDISPYSANVAFILYACDDLSHSVTDASRTFMIQLQVNEKPMNIPGCDSLMCPYEQARKVYSNLIDRCDIENVCDPQPPPSRSSHVLVNMLLFVLVLVLGKCI